MSPLTTARTKLRKHCLPGIALTAAPSKDLVRVGRSKLGGAPDVPVDFVWPVATRTGNGKSLTAPLAFVAQIALADVARVHEDPLLPAEGLLLFFTLDLIRVYQHIGFVKERGRSVAPAGATFVTYFAHGTKLTRRAPPDDLPATHRAPESTLKFRAVETWPQVEGTVAGDPGRGRVELTEAEWRAWAEAGVASPRMAMLGHPHGCEYPIGEGADERLLLSLDANESRLPWGLFGRNGFLFFHAPAKALRARQWDAVTHKEW